MIVQLHRLIVCTTSTSTNTSRSSVAGVWREGGGQKEGETQSPSQQTTPHSEWGPPQRFVGPHEAAALH